MLSIAMNKMSNTPSIPIPMELPKIDPSYNMDTDKKPVSPVRNIKCTSDNMNFGITPPEKNFMVNLKSRMDKM